MVELAFGSAFLPAANSARILLIAAIGYAIARFSEACLQGLRCPLDSAIGEGVAVPVAIIVVFALAPLFGIEGTRLASLLACSTAALFMWHGLMVFSRASG